MIVPATARRYQRGTLAERFWSYVDRRGDAACWEWRGTVDRGGYGVLSSGARRPNDSGRTTAPTVYAHKLAWELLCGYAWPGPLRRACRNKLCVNPNHMVPGQRQSTQDRPQIRVR